jgi:ribosomal-protein-alanine N-acetyltransferase
MVSYDSFIKPILRGARILARAPKPTDIRDRLQYGRNAEFRRMVGGDPGALPPLTLDEVQRWYSDTEASPFAWMLEYQGRCIGRARLHSLSETDRRARYAIGICDPTVWGIGLGAEATRLVLAFAFDTLHLHRVDLRVLEFNHRAIACYRKCGFVQEGVERDGAWIGGEWHSDVLMSILEHEYRAVKSTWQEV